MSTSWVQLLSEEQRLTGRWRKLSLSPCSAVPPHTFSYYSSFGFYQLAVRRDTALAAEWEDQKKNGKRKEKNHLGELFLLLYG